MRHRFPREIVSHAVSAPLVLSTCLTAWGYAAGASHDAVPRDAVPPNAVSSNAVPQDAVGFDGPVPAGLVQHDPLSEASGLVALLRFRRPTSAIV